jgi:hypothetical protein
MANTDDRCSKCEGKMEVGFIHNRLLGSPSIEWVEGTPEYSALNTIKLIGKRMRFINRANRCTACGYLELYTSDEIHYG